MTIFITTTIINNPIVQRSEKIQYSFDYLLMFSSGYLWGIVGIRAVDFLVSNKGAFNRLERYKNKGNYIRIDTDFIFTTIKINLDVNYRQFKETSFAAQMNAAKLHWWTRQKNNHYNNKCLQVYRSLFLCRNVGSKKATASFAFGC